MKLKMDKLKYDNMMAFNQTFSQRSRVPEFGNEIKIRGYEYTTNY